MALTRKGTQRVTLRLTKAGRKAVAQARRKAKGKRRRAARARRRLVVVVAARATDRAGNSSSARVRKTVRR